MQNYIALFFTGLLTGGVSCMAVQGGLLAAALAAGNSKSEAQNLKPEPLGKRAMIIGTMAFLAAKLVSHIILGGLLGLIGGVFTLSLPVLTVLQIVASVFMIGTAGNLLELHPIFRYFVIQPPHWAGTFLRRQAKTGQWFVPALLGFFTFLIPCGATQAAMAQSITAGSMVNGALTLGSFILGTLPVFLLLGIIMGGLTGAASRLFSRVAGVLIIFLACWNLWNVASVWGMTGQIETLVEPVKCQFIYCENQDRGQKTEDGRQSVTTTPMIRIVGNEYVVDNPNIPAGKEITLTIKNESGQSCIQAFTIPSQKYFKIIPVGKSETITFTTPTTPGELPFSCSMGMYRGKLIIK
jgi:sulfite exporter TauE/SafE